MLPLGLSLTWVTGSEFGVNFDMLQPKVVEQITTLIATRVKTRHNSGRER